MLLQRNLLPFLGLLLRLLQFILQLLQLLLQLPNTDLDILIRIQMQLLLLLLFDILHVLQLLLQLLDRHILVFYLILELAEPNRYKKGTYPQTRSISTWPSNPSKRSCTFRSVCRH